MAESSSGDTATSTEVRSPTSTETSTEALTQGNVTVTGGAGDGDTKVVIEPETGDKSGATSSVTATEKPTEGGVREAMHEIHQGLTAPWYSDGSAHFKKALAILSKSKV